MFSITGGQKLDVIEYDESGFDELSDLMGTSVKPRVDYIFENIDFSKYGDVM